MLNSSISASGLNRNPRNIRIYSSGYDPAPSLISNYFSILEMTSDKKGFKGSGEKPGLGSLRLRSVRIISVT
jgi:hypothetical protein